MGVRPLSAAQSAVLYFRAPTTGASFDLAPETALKFFRAKGLKTTWNWHDMLGEEHARAFTVAKMMDVDLLGDVRKLLDQAIAEGKSAQWFRSELIPQLQKAGWWGKQKLAVPGTASIANVQLGSVPRLNTIFRTNMQSAYSVGHWQQIKANADVAPYLMYDAVDDQRTRPAHALLDNLVLRVDDPFWSTHYPPNGWNCRCGVIQLDKEELADLGKKGPDKAPKQDTYDWQNPHTGKQYDIPEALDPGFNFNPGESYLAHLAKTAGEKIARLPDDMKVAAKTGLEAAEKAAKKAADNAALQKTVKDAQHELAIAEAAQALTRRVAKTKAKAAEWQAKQQLQELATKPGAKAGDGGNFKYKALKQLEKEAEFKPLSAVDKVELVLVRAESLKAQHAVQAALTKYKGAVLKGKVPPPAAQAAYDSLDDEAKAVFLAKLEKAKAKQLAAAKVEADQAADLVTPAGTAPKFGDLKQIGGQGGSNAGGLYQNMDTGERFYVKWPASEDIARNEVLAGRLYELAGIEVPQVYLIQTARGPAVASRIIDGLESQKKALTSGKVQGVYEGYAMDAWLANWDVVGLGFDNLLVKAGRAIRVDTGGALRYRAQGGLKGAAWSDEVLELESLRSAGTNSQAAAVFGRITQAQLDESVRRVLAIQADDIRALVKDYGPKTAKAQRELVDTLLARQAYLRRKFPHLDDAPAPVAAGRVSALEHKQITEARSNGYAIHSDKGDIEDQQVLLWQEVNADGDLVTAASLKVRGQYMDTLDRLVDSSRDGAPSVSFTRGDLDGEIVTAIKGMAMRHAKGMPLEAKDVQRATKALDSYAAARKSLEAAVARGDYLESALKEMDDYYLPWLDALNEAAGYAPGGAFKLKLPSSSFSGFIPERVVAQVDTPNPWTLRPVSRGFRSKQIQGGHAKEVAGDVRGDSGAYEAVHNGYIVRYWPDRSNVHFALRGTVEVRKVGGGATDADDILRVLDDLGVDTAAPSALQMEELYLTQIAYHRRDDWGEFKRLTRLKKPEERVQRMRTWISDKIGSDVTQLPGYAPAGVRQAFDHGRLHRYRPDLVGAEWDKFTRDYRLFHNLTADELGVAIDQILNSGGQMAATTDKLRRGIRIGGMSPTADLESGGAAYFFTRIKSTRSVYGHRGLVWKSDLVKRMDSISYDGDKYGRTTGNTVQANRRTGVNEWRSAAGSRSNETIFKNGLSLFDQLEHIMVGSETEKRQVLQILQRHKLTEWPDGRSLDEVVRIAR